MLSYRQVLFALCLHENGTAAQAVLHIPDKGRLAILPHIPALNGTDAQNVLQR